jgi:hypothetical protein
VRALRDKEAAHMGRLQQATSFEEVRAIMTGNTYTKK